MPRPGFSSDPCGAACSATGRSPPVQPAPAAAGYPAAGPRPRLCTPFFAEVHSVRTADRTLFDGIYAVPPGAALLARDGRVKIRPYWDTDFPAAAELATDPRSGQSRANLL